MQRDRTISEFLSLTRSEAKALYGLDDLNYDYFQSLLKKSTKSDHHSFVIGNNIQEKLDRIYPTAIASESLLKHLPVTEYDTLKSSKSAGDATLWIKKMQAGSGTSIERKKYLSRIQNIPIEKVMIGSKGTDLFAEVSGHQLSLAELQILQTIKYAENGKIKEVIFQDIVSSDTASAINSIWKKKSYLDPHYDYETYFSLNESLQHLTPTYQMLCPTLNRDKVLTCQRLAPAGHALFGVEALLVAFDQNLPIYKGKHLISSIGNGEDLSSSPDELMISFMIDNEIPIAMVTTTKTPIDLKGGQIAMITALDGPFVTILEKAQAEQAGILNDFYTYGLKEGDKKAFFNTNLVLINYSALTPLLNEMKKTTTRDEFLAIIAPDLILNKKQHAEGENRIELTQLEGAMGSTMLNLDQYFRKKYRKPLVHFLNVNLENRTRFFSPIKTAFDFILQFYSDRFTLDLKKFTLIDNAPTTPIEIRELDPYYIEVEHALKTFEDCSLLRLKSLSVIGKVDFSHLTLGGDLKVKSLDSQLKHLSLSRNVSSKEKEITGEHLL